ncbi:MAG: arginine--tRNA ligase, partial [Clostridia bacterium]|nr:arginine--tRNA ligase [Clostridia bacterium]
MDMMTRIATLTADCLASTWPEAQGLPTADEIRGLLAVPPNREMGDYAFPVFRLAKALRMGPPVIAKTLCEKWGNPEVARVEPVNGYVNFFLNRVNFAKETLTAVMEKGEAFGASDMGNGKTVCIDYSSINIAKRFGVGHLSTTMIGHSLKRIHDFLGYKTVGINHLGDWGTQFGKMIYAYKTWGSKAEVDEKGVSELLRLYVKFHEEAEKDPTLDDKGRAWFKKIEEKDEEAIAIWEWFKDITLKDTARVYELLGVEFDSYAGEAFYNDKMDVVIDELREKNLLTISEGASVVDLEEDKMPPCIIMRSDGATLYATRDLAAAYYRKKVYDFDKCLYV